MVLISGLTKDSTLENGKRIRDMDTEFRNGLMALIIKDTGETM